MAKIKKKKMAIERIPPSWDTDESRVPTNILMLGKVDKDLNGLNNLKVLSPDTFSIPGRAVSKLDNTTNKSRQFHASFR